MSDSREKHYDSWIGVDLDGTLAKQPEDRKYVPDRIGKPVKAMLDRVKKWLDDGETVKIFTARADDEKAVTAIKKWLHKQGLPNLDVTNLKDPGMKELWDDRAVSVEKNTGKLAESIVDILMDSGYWNEYWLSPKAELIRAVPGHNIWARKNVLRPDEWHKDDHGNIIGVYDSMTKKGWQRVLIENNRIYVDAYRCTLSQMSELKLVAMDRRLIIVDDKTGRDIFNPAIDEM